MRFVFGNNDIDRHGLQKKCDVLGFGVIADQLRLSVEGKDILVLHGTRNSVVDQEIDSQVYDYVFHGHTHLRRDEKIGRTRVVNPGALYQTTIYSIATLDLLTDTLAFYQVDYE